MSAAICTYLQPVWDVLRRKLLMFTLTPATRCVSAASMALSGLSTQMGNYMHGFAADFYPLHAEEVSEAAMDSEPPFPELVGLAQRLLEATWVHSPVVAPLVLYSPSPSPVLAPVPDRDLDEMRSPTLTPAVPPTMDRDGARLSSPPPIPSLTAHPEDQLRFFVEIPPPRSKGRKGKGKARARTPSPSPAPPSPPRTLMTRAAAARLAASSHQEARPGVASGSQVTLDVSPAPPRPLKRKVAALGDARSKRPRREVTPESPEPDSSSSSKLAAAQLALLLGAVPKPLAPPVCIACSLKGLKPEDCIIPQGEQGCIPCQRSHRGICSFRAKLKDQMPDFETFLEFGQSSLTNLQNLFEWLQRISATNGVATPPWLLHPSHILPPRTRVIPYQESEPDADEASVSIDTDAERATLDALDRDVGDLDDFECYQ
ncbi:hypothetical protein BDZ97DRAFT_1761984 [Flammula alnicola]|nr:hypothetical protein BDZ97DRAFT_1761984 [Flammula alnicola]